MAAITLVVQEQEIKLATYEVDGQMLYKAQDLLKATSLTKKQRDNLLSNWKISMSSKGILDFQVSLKGGRNQGTYLSKRNLFKLAAYFDAIFEDAVFEAFEALTEGRVDKAVQTAQQVVRAEGKIVRRQETDALKAFQEAKGYYLSGPKSSQEFGRLTSLTNKLLGLEAGQRDILDASKLVELMTFERMITNIFKRSLDKGISFETTLEVIRDQKATLEAVINQTC